MAKCCTAPGPPAPCFAQGQILDLAKLVPHRSLTSACYDDQRL